MDERVDRQSNCEQGWRHYVPQDPLSLSQGPNLLPGYTASMYRPGTKGGTKANFSQSVNALGRMSGVDEIPSKLRTMMRLDVEENIKPEEFSSHPNVAEQRSVHESKASSWVAGNEILRLLALETMKGDVENVKFGP